ncbi:hypothetical protein DTO013F2_10532 [Penicillium roqueforti]|nr:hypothetical protein DTO013F2_10532 [Penicillium roqueforti]
MNDTPRVLSHPPSAPLRFSTPPPPSVEDDLNESLFGPASPPLEPSNPAILEEQLPDLESFDLANDDDVDMKEYGKPPIFVMIYVDDLLVLCASESDI